jgi:hypothetical protein
LVEDRPRSQIATNVHRRTNLYVVQIGSNDGLTGDPVHLLLRSNPSWTALLSNRLHSHSTLSARIIPIPQTFNSLRSLLPIKLEAQMFYSVDPVATEHMPHLPCLFEQIRFFDRGHTTRHFGITLDRFTVSTQVATSPSPLSSGAVTSLKSFFYTLIPKVTID